MPKISVIVTAVNGLVPLNRCLKALGNQRGQVDAEIIVAGAAQNGLAEHLAHNFPRVRLIYCDERITIPELRSLGMAEATGEIVVLTEDRCVPSEDWLAEIVKAHQIQAARGNEYQVVGGPIEPDGVSGALNWAVYLCEYSSLMLPMDECEVTGVAGNNASYRRETLERAPAEIKRDYWEYFLHEELRNTGVRILSTPAVIVRKSIDFDFIYFMRQRFHYSRSFAGMRGRRATALRRLIYASITPGLPLLMTLRIAKPIFQKRRYRKEFLFSLPILGAFMISYAAGECVGYLFGQGRSLPKVE
jgi:GT2 family glycosyltransferase